MNRTTPGGTTGTMTGSTPGGTTGTTPGSMNRTTPGGTTGTMPGTTPGGTTGTMPGTIRSDRGFPSVVTYIVKEQESIQNILDKFGIELEDFLTHNALNTIYLKPGMTVNIPTAMEREED
jgi:hypothetical protein